MALKLELALPPFIYEAWLALRWIRRVMGYAPIHKQGTCWRGRGRGLVQAGDVATPIPAPLQQGILGRCI